jgi:hypothetical protein
MCHLCEERSYDGFRHAAAHEAPDGKPKPAAKDAASDRKPVAQPAPEAVK